MQLRDHANIFALGDVADLPIQNSTHANMHQIRVITHNAMSHLQGLSMTGKYKLQSKLPIVTGIASANVYSTDNGVEEIGSENPVADWLRYHRSVSSIKKSIEMYSGKNLGISKIWLKMNSFEKPTPTGAEVLFAMDH